jgi:hypothetical protein
VEETPESWFDVAVHDAVEVLSAVRALSERGDMTSAEDLLNQAIEQRCGLSVRALCRLTPEHIWPTLVYAGAIQRPRTVQLAMLLLSHGELSASDDQVRAAMCLLVFATDDLTSLDNSVAAPLVDLVERVDLRLLSDDMLCRTLRVLELAGRIDLAERVLFVWIDRDVRAAFEDAMALYGRLRGHSEAHLVAGGFSSQRVLDGLDALQEAAGRDRPRRDGVPSGAAGPAIGSST